MSSLGTQLIPLSTSKAKCFPLARAKQNATLDTSAAKCSPSLEQADLIVIENKENV